LGDHKRAIEVFLQAQKMSDPPDWEIHYFLGNITFIILNVLYLKNNFHTFSLLGECYMKINQLEDARTHLICANELTTNENPYIALSKSYMIENRIIDAIDVYTKALVSV
jgi:Flp pilus assembly protein TadD